MLLQPNNDLDLPSVEEPDDDIENEIPDFDWEWVEGWRAETNEP